MDGAKSRPVVDKDNYCIMRPYHSFYMNNRRGKRMDRLKAMQTFVRIVEANSFSKAAETLSLPRASVTATMQNLEAYLGTRLLHRTTRRIALTPDGEAYFDECLRILGAIDEAENAFRGQAAQGPSGKLRLDLPGALGRNVV